MPLHVEWSSSFATWLILCSNSRSGVEAFVNAVTDCGDFEPSAFLERPWSAFGLLFGLVLRCDDIEKIGKNALRRGEPAVCKRLLKDK